MKATIQQLKQRTQHCQITKHNLVFSGNTSLSCLFVHCLSIPEKLPRTAMEEYQNNKEDPSTQCTFLAQHLHALKHARVHTFNLYLRKLFWKTWTMRLPNFSKRTTFPPRDNRKNKEQNPLMQAGECSNSLWSDEMKEILSTQHHTGGEKTGRLHIQKVEDLEEGSSIKSGATMVALAQPN